MGCEGQLFVWATAEQLNSTIENVTRSNGRRRNLNTDFYFALHRDNQRSGKQELRSFGRISRASQSSLVEAVKLGAAEWSVSDSSVCTISSVRLAPFPGKGLKNIHRCTRDSNFE